MQSKVSFEDYEGFLEKHKPKKTTDDCYTPPEIYAVVLDYCVERYGIDPATVIRPFCPGGDYEGEDYTGKVVVDNPPFSMLTKICTYYLERGIKFFLFAPALTLFSARKIFERMNHIVVNCQITYENGAKVSTSFLTNMGDGQTLVETEPDLAEKINEVDAALLAKVKQHNPTYDYPDYVTSSALLNRLSKYGQRLEFKRGEVVPISALDKQRAKGKTIFGGGILLSEKAAAEKAAAEKAAAEKAAAEKAAAEIWQLSEREKQMVAMLG